MTVTPPADGTVEVRLRYRPVGDVLTVTVRAGAPPGPRHRTEPDDDTAVEWERRPDGTLRLHGLQLIGARSRITDGDTIPDLPAALHDAALALIVPGRRHHDHPSTHRPTTPTTVRELTVTTPTSALTFGHTPCPVTRAR